MMIRPYWGLPLEMGLEAAGRIVIEDG